MDLRVAFLEDDFDLSVGVAGIAGYLGEPDAKELETQAAMFIPLSNIVGAGYHAAIGSADRP